MPKIRHRIPRQKRSRETVRAIVEAARRLLASGDGAMTTSRVAKLAGVSVGTLYEYFPSKEPLIKAVEAGAWETILPELMSQYAAMGEGRPLGELIAEVTRLAVAFMVQSGGLHGVSLDGPEAREAREPMLEALVALLTERVEASYRDQFRPADVPSAFRFAIQAVFNLTGVAIQVRDPMLESGEFQRLLGEMMVRFLVKP
jgi:AcrR family transcriptional regulator